MNLRMMRPRRTILAVSIVVLAVLVAPVVAVIRHDATGGIRLEGGGDGSVFMSSQAPGVRQYHTAYFGPFCVSEPGSVVIRSIDPVRPHGGIKITDFSVLKSNREILSGEPGRLRDKRSYIGSARVTTECLKDEHGDLFVEVYKPRAENAWAREYRVNYDSDGRERSVRLRFGFGLCEQSQDDCKIF